jgi:UDP-2,3-diacylglucosamine pyrophosphatase LpxH
MISSHLFDFLLFRFADRWQRLSEQIAEMAIEHAKKNHKDVVVCGHTHFIKNIRKDGIEYFNLASWNNTPSYLLVINDDGSAHYKIIA